MRILNGYLARLEAGYRILSFLALGVVLLVISLLYARSRKKISAGEKPTEAN